jgi:hypothetical protein
VRFQPGDFDMVVLCHASFIRSQRILNRLKWLVSQQCQCERLLRRLKADVHSAFYEPHLNLVVRKGEAPGAA